MNVTWHGFTMRFGSLRSAKAWIATLDKLHSIDPDAAERVAYAGDQWKKELAKELAKVGTEGGAR